jgi:DNA-directed RNA polymerase subunit RPC12/RpoP
VSRANLRCDGCGTESYSAAPHAYDGTRCEKCGGVVRVIDRTSAFLRAVAQREKAPNPNRRRQRRLG